MNCDSLVIDTIIMDPQYPELIIDTSQTPKLALQKFSSGSVPVFYQTDSNLTRRTTLRIIAHSLDRKIDTTIILVAKHSTAPEPLLTAPLKAKIGDQVLIPLYLHPTRDSFTITHFAFHLSYDGDVLTLSQSPLQYETNHTLSSGGAVTFGTPKAAGVLCTVDLTAPLTEASNLALPLIYLRMNVTLSRNLFSAIRLDTFSISNTAPLPLCTIPETMFLVDPLCGDSTISKYMFNGTMPGFLSVHPNPNSGTVIEAEIYVSRENTLTLEIINAEGKNMQKVFEGKYFTIGKHVLLVNTSSLPSGKYILRMRTSDGNSSQQEIIILR
ncbi:MAG: T9SS type A sorting domain-containing protein [Candidatus Kapaibacterium sp.]